MLYLGKRLTADLPFFYFKAVMDFFVPEIFRTGLRGNILDVAALNGRCIQLKLAVVGGEKEGTSWPHSL